MPEGRSDAITELVRILRDQLARKDEQIAALEQMLRDANRRISEQQVQIARLLAPRAQAGAAAPTPAARGELPERPRPAPPATAAAPPTPAAAPPSGASSVAGPATPRLPPSVPPPVAPPPRPPKQDPQAPVRLPDLGPQIHVIAEAVVSAAAAKRETEEAREITPRLDRADLRAGHARLDRERRGLWPWRARAGR